MPANPEKYQLTLGFIPLTDCAPLVVALENGLFAAEGLDVSLSREASWATLRDKLAYGLLDGAQMLAALPIAMSLGLGSPKIPTLTALGLDLNGNAITVSNQLFLEMAEAAPRAMSRPEISSSALRAVILAHRAAGRPPLTFAMVYPYSSHHYLLRHWLAAGGIDPDTDLKLTVVPPPLMAERLAAGVIDGYCVGEPWNALAVQQGLGRVIITSHAIWNNHPEKVLGVTEAWAERHPHTHLALLRALLRACAWLDQPEHRPEIVALLAQRHYLDAPADAIGMSMTGTYKFSADQPPVFMEDFNVFHRYAANFPWRSHAEICLAQMARWKQLRDPLDIRAVVRRVYRPDIYRQAAEELGMPYPTIDYKPESCHDGPWMLEQASSPLEMGSDLALEGLDYHPQQLSAYLQSLRAGHLIGALPAG